MSLPGRLLRIALPLVKLRSQLRGISLGVRARVEDEAGRLLLVRMSYLPGWHFPGGGVELGETVEEALHRELAEEGGVALHGPPRLVGVFRNPDWTPGDHVVYFSTQGWSRTQARWGVEIEAAEFFDANALPSDTHGSVRRRLDEDHGAPMAPIW